MISNSKVFLSVYNFLIFNYIYTSLWTCCVHLFYCKTLDDISPFLFLPPSYLVLTVAFSVIPTTLRFHGFWLSMFMPYLYWHFSILFYKSLFFLHSLISWISNLQYLHSFVTQSDFNSFSFDFYQQQAMGIASLYGTSYLVITTFSLHSAWPHCNIWRYWLSPFFLKFSLLFVSVILVTSNSFYSPFLTGHFAIILWQ